MEFQWLGLQKYENIERYQREMVSEIKGTTNIFLMGIEFHPVITMGLRSDISRDFLSTQDELISRGFEIVKTDRGGQATLHSPGQLVIYPMLDLRAWKLGIKDFVALLMGTTAGLLQTYGLKAAYNAASPGVYTPQGKVAFCGIKVDQGVVRHGMSLNVSNDLAFFGEIRSCGHSGARLDRVIDYRSLEPREVFVDWAEAFGKHFSLSASRSLDMNT